MHTPLSLDLTGSTPEVIMITWRSPLHSGQNTHKDTAGVSLLFSFAPVPVHRSIRLWFSLFAAMRKGIAVPLAARTVTMPDKIQGPAVPLVSDPKRGPPPVPPI